MNTTRLLTRAEISAFRRDHADKLDQHQRIVSAMRASGISMLRTEPGAADANRFRRRGGRDEEHGVISEREGGSEREAARNYGGSRFHAAGRQETVDADDDDFGALREHLKNCGLADDDVEHAIEIARAAREGADEPPDLAGGGTPRAGGSMTPLRGAAMHRALAGDSGAARRSFAARHPNVARIRHV
jgi:hypothetical protein